MAFTCTEPQMGYLGSFANTDAGVSFANSGATVYPTPPTTLGMIVRGYDPTYGQGEFILLRGVASTTVGSAVTYDYITYQTALLPATANLAMPVACSMAATTALLFGWYQISGVCTFAKSVAFSVTTITGVPIYVAVTAGLVSTSATSGVQIENAQSANLASVASTTGTLLCVIQRPGTQGAIL